MKRIFGSCGCLFLLVSFSAIAWAEEKLVYPEPPKNDQVDDYFGTKVADPYRPLEDLDSPATRKWIEEENKLTFDYLSKIPERTRIKTQLTALWDYERYGVPFHEGGNYFYPKNKGLDNQSIFYITPTLPGKPRVLIDPNVLSADGTVALSGLSVPHDGKLLAYGVATAGSDWQEWRVREIASGKDLFDTIKWIKFSSASWNREGTGFYYSGYDAPHGQELKGTNYFQKVYFHKIGTPQSKDALIYERKDHQDWLFNPEVTEDGRYLVITVSQGSDPKNRVFYKDLRQPDSKVVELLDKQDAAYNFLDNDGSVFWFRTDLNAPRARVVAIDVQHPDQIKELVPQTPDTLQSVTVVGERFVASYLKDAAPIVRLFELNGKPAGEIAMPAMGTASGFTGKRTDTETFYSYTSFVEPPIIYRYDFKSAKSSVLFRPKVDFKSAEFETEQVFYRSKDGTRIPMFITHRKGLEKSGQSPTLLYGYGGFNNAVTPVFSAATAAWLKMGGTYAVANLRGGGEYGEDWHLAGTKTHKQNVFDDFIAAGEWLIANKYTSTAKLAINGRSNGGLLVGAALTQRPGLWGAALPVVGVMDMLRFHKFTIGWAWTSDYGSSDRSDEFPALYKYSPLHNVKPAKYPPTLITTADHDDRVFPGHSFKFAAALQAAQQGDAPVLIRIETRAGHGAGKPTAKIIEDVTDQWSFLVKNLGMRIPF